MFHLEQTNLTFAIALVLLAILLYYLRLTVCIIRLIWLAISGRKGYLKVEIHFQVASLQSSAAFFASAGLAFGFGLGGLSWLAVFAAVGFLSRSSGGFGLVFGGRFAG